MYPSGWHDKEQYSEADKEEIRRRGYWTSVLHINYPVADLLWCLVCGEQKPPHIHPK